MNIRRVRALARKEFIQILRDPKSLGMAIVIPVILLILFGSSLTLDVDHVPMAIWNQDNSQVSTEFILHFKNSRYFKITGYYNNYRDLEKLMDKNAILMALIIPKDFSRHILSGESSPVQFLVDGSDSNTASIAMGYLDSVVGVYNSKLAAGASVASGVINTTPIDLRPRTWFNPNRDSPPFIIPGLIAVILMIISALLTSLTVAREWERGTMEQLISTPVKARELIAGKFIPYFIIGLIDLIIAVLMAQFIYCIPFRGSLILLFVLSSLFLTGALMMGILISVVARSQLLASQMAIMATFIPTYLLSGFVYPIYNMPSLIQMITYFVPARYFIVVLHGIYLKGVGLKALWTQALFLLIYAVLMTFLAVKKFKKKVA